VNAGLATVLYVVNSLGWSLVGFAVGWLASSTRRDVRRIKEAVVPDDPGQRPDWSHPTGTATRWLGVVVAVLAVLTVATGYVTTRRVADVAACQADYNHRFTQVSQLRAQLADGDRAAQQNLLLTIYKERGNQAAQLRAFTAWADTVQRNEVQRKAHPLPELPEGDCR
jgi:hypothetical protein